MIIWHGRGLLVGGIAFGSLLASEFLSESYFRDDRFYQQHGWPKLAAFLFAAGAVQWLQHSTEQDTIGAAGRRIPKDPVLRRADSFFFVPVRYWPAILCALGIGFYFVRTTGS